MWSSTMSRIEYFIVKIIDYFSLSVTRHKRIPNILNLEQNMRANNAAFIYRLNCMSTLALNIELLTCKIVGCWMWWPLTNVNASACSGVTVQTPSSNEIKQCRGWIDGPNNCSWLVFAEPTYWKAIEISCWHKFSTPVQWCCEYLLRSVRRWASHDGHPHRYVWFPLELDPLDNCCYRCCYRLTHQAVFSSVFGAANQLVGVAHGTWWTLAMETKCKVINNTKWLKINQSHTI